MEKVHRQVFKDYLPFYSRIIVDYEAKTPKASFSYTQKRFSPHHIHVATYLNLMMILPGIIFVFTFVGINFWAGNMIGFIITGKVNISQFIRPPELPITSISCLNNKYCMVIRGGHTTDYIPIIKRLPISVILIDYIGGHAAAASNNDWIFALVFIVGFFGTPEVAYQLIKKDKGKMAFVNGLIGKFAGTFVHYTKIRIDKDDLLGNYAYIYNFRNMELRYNAVGDFGKYLKRIQILEFPTKYHHVSSRKHGRKKWRDDTDESQWVAKFMFSKKPKNGYILVDYT